MSCMSALYTAGVTPERMSNYLQANPGVNFDDALDILEGEYTFKIIDGRCPECGGESVIVTDKFGDIPIMCFKCTMEKEDIPVKHRFRNS
jgi:hypothetical protein